MDEQYKLNQGYTTRFAPSPTGPLHFGSLVTALGSWLRAKSCHGQWIIRIEDIDPPREVEGAAKNQLKTLARFGLVSDQPVLYQSTRLATYQKYLQTLLKQDLAYWCGCSTRELPASGIYPGTCSAGLPTGRSKRAIRLRTACETVSFIDALQGLQHQNPHQEFGDFIIRRGDGLIAYQLAVVVDDHEQGITEVVRGADLMDSVGRQCLLFDALGAPRPQYLHLPLLVDGTGRKLSKSDGADPIERQSTESALRLALRALGHEPPIHVCGVDSQRRWALDHWSLAQVPKGPIAIDSL